jgi:outer membrane protein assembly factor BamD
MIAPDVTRENIKLFNDSINAGKPVPAPGVVTPTGPNEPPRTDQPSQAPLQLERPGEGTGVGVQVVSAPSSPAAADPNAVIKSVGPVNTALPAAEKPAEAPMQVNDIKSGTTPAASADGKKKKPKADLSDESSSKKKKKKGLNKINPF